MVNEKHKDRLFRAIFGGSNPEYALSLYNAVNNTDYSDASELEIYTIDDTVYMGMKNDISFIFDDEINLYEHQSTYNPNMPLRGLFYMAKQYEKYVEDKGLDIYSSTILSLPTPKYVVFYNGKREVPETENLRLSNSFKKDASGSAIEVIASMINVNYGQNKDIMSRCRALHDYSLFIKKIRDYNRNNDTKTAVDLAINDAIDLDLLDGFFRKHKAEVTDMILTEYNEQRTLDNRYKLGFEEGIKEGKENAALRIEKKINKILKADPSISLSEAVERGLLK